MLETRKAKQVAEHPQHFPPRTRFAERLHATGKALDGAFHIDERAGGLGKRADRQHHVCVLERSAMLERTHRDDELRLFQRRKRARRIVAVEVGLDAQQEISLERLGNHLRRVLARADSEGHGPGDIAADGVRRFCEHSQTRTCDVGERLRKRM